MRQQTICDRNCDNGEEVILSDSLVDGLHECRYVVRAVDEEARADAVPQIRNSVDLEKVAGDHVECALRLRSRRADVREGDRRHLVLARRIVHELVHPRVERVLVLNDALVQNEIRRDQHEQGELIPFAVKAAVGQLVRQSA